MSEKIADKMKKKSQFLIDAEERGRKMHEETHKKWEEGMRATSYQRMTDRVRMQADKISADDLKKKRAEFYITDQETPVFEIDVEAFRQVISDEGFFIKSSKTKYVPEERDPEWPVREHRVFTVEVFW